MATTGVLNGTLMAIYVGGTKVATLLTNSISINRPTRSIASKDDATWDAKAINRANWSKSGRAFFKFDAGYGFRNLYAAIVAGAAVTVRSSTAVSGDYYYEGSAFLTEVGADYADNDNSEYSFTLEGTGALSETLIT
jgi:hypothetical protein